jgi:hypothetical protein
MDVDHLRLGMSISGRELLPVAAQGAASTRRPKMPQPVYPAIRDAMPKRQRRLFPGPEWPAVSVDLSYGPDTDGSRLSLPTSAGEHHHAAPHKISRSSLPDAILVLVIAPSHWFGRARQYAELILPQPEERLACARLPSRSRLRI